MTTRRTKKNVPYSASTMFDLVADIEKYPEFIPYCVGLRVLDSQLENSHRALTAEMIVAYHAFREKFKCRVRLEREKLEINVDYLDGPFRRLVTHWRFTDNGEGSEVDFTIDFEFRNFLLQGLASAMFEKVFARMSDAFIDRADRVYEGRR